MLVGDTILLLMNFLVEPVWHLIVLYVIMFLVIIIRLINSLGF